MYCTDDTLPWCIGTLLCTHDNPPRCIGTLHYIVHPPQYWGPPRGGGMGCKICKSRNHEPYQSISRDAQEFHAFTRKTFSFHEITHEKWSNSASRNWGPQYCTSRCTGCGFGLVLFPWTEWQLPATPVRVRRLLGFKITSWNSIFTDTWDRNFVSTNMHNRNKPKNKLIKLQLSIAVLSKLNNEK